MRGESGASLMDDFLLSLRGHRNFEFDGAQLTSILSWGLGGCMFFIMLGWCKIKGIDRLRPTFLHNDANRKTVLLPTYCAQKRHSILRLRRGLPWLLAEASRRIDIDSGGTNYCCPPATPQCSDTLLYSRTSAIWHLQYIVVVVVHLQI